ncbi:hypothetical protein AOA77_17595 [Pseudomonas paraeruginosa]|nr:hypothetical protein AN920_11510 [Pseudomonas paraeruginosa]RQF85718.1 hypothetical protein IPC241_17745 [Pseudomonas aeruginosa]KQB31282.1 hypothetical protein AOA77_17595 [Pseudomonas paraeruginosa]PHJ32608.1 hypothetical protein CDG78_09140 [Pseudomonas paraeruginosa]VFT39072.1 Uncharacterised protein [Pseudomonas aeruginosa]
MRSRVTVALLILATVAAAEERPLYSAQDSLRRAQVGTFSPRLAPPVRVQETAQGAARQFERMECRHDPSRPLERAIICTPVEPEKVKLSH